MVAAVEDIVLKIVLVCRLFIVKLKNVHFREWSCWKKKKQDGIQYGCKFCYFIWLLYVQSTVEVMWPVVLIIMITGISLLDVDY